VAADQLKTLTLNLKPLKEITLMTTPHNEDMNDTPNLLIEEIDAARVPEKFKNPETGALRLDALVNSYSELERKMSGKTAVPKSAEEYCINCDHGLFEVDNDINERLHAKGMSQDQVQEVYDLAAQKMVPMLKDIADDSKADREIEKLMAHFGGAEKWTEVSRQLLAFGQRNLPADVLDNLSSSFEGVQALYRMMQSDEPGLRRTSDSPSSMDTTEMQSMMRDPRYWRDRDPAFLAKVTEGFKNAYGKK
jgi:hypothetical protein